MTDNKINAIVNEAADLPDLDTFADLKSQLRVLESTVDLLNKALEMSRGHLAAATSMAAGNIDLVEAADPVPGTVYVESTAALSSQ
jgi:hypothetical protein